MIWPIAPTWGRSCLRLGCFCNGSTVIRNAGRLRLKESDRISAMQEELKKMGARIEVDGDTVTITGVALHAPAEPLYGHNDHRIVMALAVAVYAAGPARPAARGRGREQKLGPHFGIPCAGWVQKSIPSRGEAGCWINRKPI